MKQNILSNSLAQRLFQNILIISLLMVSGTALFAQNPFFVDSGSTPVEVSKLVGTMKYVQQQQTTQDRIDISATDLTATYFFKEGNLNHISFRRFYEDRERAQVSFEGMLLYLDRIMAVTVPIQDSKKRRHFHAFTDNLQFDLYLNKASQGWQVSVERNTFQTLPDRSPESQRNVWAQAK